MKRETLFYLALAGLLAYVVYRYRAPLQAAAAAAGVGGGPAGTKPSGTNTATFDPGLVPPSTDHPETIPPPGAGYPVPYTPPAPTQAPTSPWVRTIEAVASQPKSSPWLTTIQKVAG